jgi:hypothetical protein
MWTGSVEGGTSYCVAGDLATMATTPMLVLLCLPAGTW